jgi:long-chain acyl-CoA synthetase
MGGFWQHAQANPTALAIVDPDGREISAGELLGEANRLVHALRALGLAPGDTFAAVLPNGHHPFVALLAAQQAGWYYVPINYRLAPPEIAYILRDSEAKALITHARFAANVAAAADDAAIPNAARLAHGTIDGFVRYDDYVDGFALDAPGERASGAAMHYTSGTTGFPKGVKRALSPLDPDTTAELFTFLFGLFGIPKGEGNVHLCTSPNYHTAVTTFAGNSLHMEHAVVCMDKWDPAEALRLIGRYRCTHTHMVPTQFHRMLQLPDKVRAGADVSSMRWAIHAAAPCPVDTKRKMLDWWGPVIWEYYAATEGGGSIAPPDEWIKYPGTVGRAWPTSELKISDDDGNVLPAGEPGTVWMRMGAASFEYKGDADKTRKSQDAEGYFTVGDVGYLNDDGYLFLCDRKSDMIIAGGVNIYPAEIEAAILEHPQVGDAAVFGIPDDDMGERIHAVIEPAPGMAGDEALRASLVAHIQGRLAKFKWPRSIEFIDELPREPTGKLLKRTLRDPYWEGRDRAI